MRTPLRGDRPRHGMEYDQEGVDNGGGKRRAASPWSPMSSPSSFSRESASPSLRVRIDLGAVDRPCANISPPVEGDDVPGEEEEREREEEEEDDDDEVRAAVLQGEATGDWGASGGAAAAAAAATAAAAAAPEPPWMAYSFALRSALVGTQSVVFAKSTSLLLRTSVTGESQFGKLFTYCVLAALGATALFWCQRLNAALRRYPSLVIIPALQINWLVWSMVAGGLYFDEFAAWHAHEYALFGAGIAITLVGLALLEPEAHTLSDAPPSTLVAQQESDRLRNFLQGSPPAGREWPGADARAAPPTTRILPPLATAV